MKAKTKILRSILGGVFLLSGLVGVTAYVGAGNREGNGGDHIRATFLKMGRAVVHYLRDTEEGARIVSTNHLDLDALESGLDIEKITVIDGELIDNGGSEVDATGEPGRILLKKDRWYEHFERQRDVYYLVLHELLRQAAVNDDNYVISRALNPFPVGERVITRITSLIPVIGAESIDEFLDLDPHQMIIAGNGCKANETFVELDSERNVLDLSFNGYALSRISGREACAIRMNVKGVPGKRLVLSQLDLLGRVNLPVGASAQIAIATVLSAEPGPQYRKILNTDGGAIQGRVVMRENPEFSTACSGDPSILGLNTAASMVASPDGNAGLDVDRISLYFRVETCDAPTIAKSKSGRKGK